jgi:hypothetical protein
MSKEELKMNRNILKIVKTEKRKGRLENIYVKTALQTISGF